MLNCLLHLNWLYTLSNNWSPGGSPPFQCPVYHHLLFVPFILTVSVYNSVIPNISIFRDILFYSILGSLAYMLRAHSVMSFHCSFSSLSSVRPANESSILGARPARGILKMTLVTHKLALLTEFRVNLCVTEMRYNTSIRFEVYILMH